MSREVSTACSVILTFIVAAAVGAPASAEDKVTYNRDVRPILADNCFACHGFDETAREADLRLDTFEHATAERDDAAAIVPGDPDASAIIQRITHDDPRKRMPPESTGHEITDEQRATLEQWIAEGAAYEDHWAFITPTRPARPEVSDPDWVANPIDGFVLAKLDESGLRPSEKADRRTLIRRVSLDLTGLPPTPEEVEAFVADESDDAYAQLVDRLLSSPRYGEHMARYWLDAARYADTHGYQYDLSRTMWPWREWVINAFNDNMPFDQFTVEQLAGDLLPDATESQRLASGFNRNHPITIEGGIIEQEYITEYVMDRVHTTSTVWLGLTMSCARCHDHKFDPISSEDFYSFYAFFNQVPEAGNGRGNDFAPTMQVTPPMQRPQLERLDETIAEAEERRDALLPQAAEHRDAWREAMRERVDGWQVAAPTEVKAAAGTEFTRLDDHSILAGGPRPGRETYEIELAVDDPVAAIRLEALTHESLPHSGAGRADNANFVLTRVEVEAAPAGETQFREVPIASASADHEQDGYPIADAVGSGGRGWAVEGNNLREDRTAEFVFNEPIEHAGGTRLRIRLVHDFGSGHSIGRFRLSTIKQPPESAVPDSTRELIEADPESLSPAQRVELDTYLLSVFGSDADRAVIQELYSLRSRRQQQAEEKVKVMVMADQEERKPTYVLEQGTYDGANKDRPVHPRTPDALPPFPEDAPRNRLGLARWLVSDDQPLTARVQVNRMWQQLFGIGIVETAGDFGTQGDWPTHQRLIDWLAVEFVESGWDVKHMMRLMVTSATYQQSSRMRSDMLEHDPRNRLLARGPRHRLDAEVVRDNALAAAGLLSDRMGGPSVYPYQAEGLWKETNNRPGFMEEYVLSEGEDLYRRSLYTFWKRSVLAPTMSAFDAPTREVCRVRRSRTNTPLQALALMNDPQFVEAARFLAERMFRAGGTFEDRVRRGFELVVGRPSSEEEVSVLRPLYEQQLRHYEQDPEAADAALAVGEGERDEAIDPVEHAALTMIARTILNLDEAMTKE